MTFRTISVAALLVFALAISATAQDAPPPTPPAPPAAPAADPIQQLNLTPEQRQQIRRLTQETRQERQMTNRRLREANAALDSGERAGPGTLSAWEKAEGVLGVSSRGIAISIPTGPVAPEGHPGMSAASYPETSPAGANEELQKAWALHWAVRRKQAKVARDYTEADRIRGLLRSAGWEVRDGKDGSVEVVRIPRAS